MKTIIAYIYHTTLAPKCLKLFYLLIIKHTRMSDNSIEHLCTQFNLQESQNNNDNYNYYDNNNVGSYDKMCTEMIDNCDLYIRIHGAKQEAKYAKCMAHYNMVCEKKY